jgi:hypothetical protein
VVGDRESGWRDLGRRLLATHPPAEPPATIGPAPATGTAPTPVRPRLATPREDAAGQPSVPAPTAAGGEPDLVIEHLEVHVVDPAPAAAPARPARTRAGTAGRSDAWDPAARHYVGGW